MKLSLPPKDIMYSPLEKNYRKKKFREVMHLAVFSDISAEWKDYIKDCRVQMLYNDPMEAFRTLLSEEERTLSNEKVQEIYPFFHKSIFNYETQGSLLLAQNGKEFFMIKDLRGRSKNLHKTCNLCKEEKYILHFKNSGAQCKRCLSRVKRDKKTLKTFIEQQMENVKNKNILLYGKKGWETTIDESFAELLVNAEVAEWGYNEIFLLLDFYDFQKNNMNYEILFQKEKIIC